MCVDSLITWYNPNWDVKFSIASPAKLRLSWQKQLLDLAFKSPIVRPKNEFFCTKFSKFNSRFSVKVSKSSWFWLGYLKRDKQLHVLSPILSSKQIVSWKYWTLKIKTFCNKYKHHILLLFEGWSERTKVYPEISKLLSSEGVLEC